jgi:hypothetical protein
MARAWLARHEPAISGQDGRRRTYVAARWLVNDFNLSVDAAWPLFLEWNDCCRPPWDADELRGILERAAAAPDDPAYPRGRKLAPPPGDWNDPFRLAREFIAEGSTWRLWNSLGWRYTGTHYEKAEEGELDRELWRFVDRTTEGIYARMLRYDPEARKPKASQTLVNNVRGALGSLIELPPKTRMPGLLEGRRSLNLLAVRNGLLDLDALLAGKTDAKDVLRPHTAEWFSCNCLPVDYQPGADCSFWVDTLNVLLQEDQQRINLLQEWAGYCLWRGFNAQKFLILCGDGGTGKSTVLAALMALLGEDNCVSITFSANGDDRFVYGPTLGKMLAFSADTSKIDRLA